MKSIGKIRKLEPGTTVIVAIALANLLYFLLLWVVYSSGRLPLFYGLLAMPFVLVLGYLLFFERTWFIWLLIAAIPFSVNFENLGFGLGLSVPGEIMLVLISGIFVAENLIRFRLSKTILWHPIVITVFLYLLWMIIGLVFSTMTVISAKFILMKLLFVLGFFLFFVKFFEQPKRFVIFMWILIAALCAVIIYTTYKHSLVAFDFKEGFEIAQPFFENHGIYTAAIAMVLPFVFVNIFRMPKSAAGSKYLPLLIIVAAVLIVGLIFGHSRAAWLSIAATIVFWILLLLRIKFSWLLGLIAIIMVLVVWQNEQIMQELKRVSHTSGEKFISHTLSSANVSTDVSNAERLNRWSCAIRMFADKPITGFGPGTFTFQYGAYQIPAEQTRMSTPYPVKGDVHSEYLKVLSEGGVLGLLTFLAVVLVTIFYGMKVFYRDKSPQKRMIALSVLLGLVTYFTHAFVNNYLETDKAASLVWIFTAAVVALDKD